MPVVPDLPTATTRPGDRWRRLVETSSAPRAVVEAAPVQPGPLEPERFRWRPEEDAAQPVRPSRLRALEALPAGGTVLDVGVGGGASSLGLVPHPGLIVGVDPLPGMLESFEASAKVAGVTARGVLGRWPEAAEAVEAADVVVCHHALYRVIEVEDFVTALTARARHRVVVEVSGRPPLSGLDPLFRAFHGVERASWAVADELEAVLSAMGLGVQREDVVVPARNREVTPSMVAFARRRLFVGPERDPEIEDFLRHGLPAEQLVAAFWWPGAADGRPDGTAGMI